MYIIPDETIVSPQIFTNSTVIVTDSKPSSRPS